MTLPLTIPVLNNPKSTKDRVFIILSTKYPLSLIQIKNQIKNTFNEEVSFQSVRKAVLKMVEEKILIKEGKQFSFNKEWIISFTKFVTILQKHYFSITKNSSKIKIGEDVTEYNLQSLTDLDFIWNGLIKKAIQEKNSPKITTFKATHFWFLIGTLIQETELIKELIKKGIKLYYICYGQTKLDQWTVKLYNEMGVRCIQKKRPKEFEEELNIGTYGNYIIQSKQPKKIVEEFRKFFAKNKKPEETSIIDITNIATMKANLKLQSIYNPTLAKSMREEIIREFE